MDGNGCYIFPVVELKNTDHGTSNVSIRKILPGMQNVSPLTQRDALGCDV